MKTLAERLADARKKKGMSQVEAAKAAGVAPGTIGNAEAGTRQQPRKLNAIAAALGVRSEWLETGKEPREAHAKPAPRQDLELRESEAEYRHGLVVVIPLLAAKASMGDGELQPADEVVLGNLPISGEWVKKWLSAQTSPDALRFFHGVGDSMEPTFGHGAILLADTGVREVKNDGIYVLEANGMLYVKRVRRRMDGSYEVSSDNPTVKTVDVLDGTRPVSILGQVLWLWNGRKV